jgi:hypothetical protein
MVLNEAGPESEVAAKPDADCGSGVHKVAQPANTDADAEWDELVDAWERAGYGSEPPRCMAEYAEELIAAIG